MSTTKIFFTCIIGSNVFFDNENYIECTYKGHKEYFQNLVKKGSVFVYYACPFFLTEKDALEYAEDIISTTITDYITNSSRGVIHPKSLESIIEYTKKGFKNLTKKDVEAFNENVFNSNNLKDYVFVDSIEVEGEVKDNEMIAIIVHKDSESVIQIVDKDCKNVIHTIKFEEPNREW